MIIRKAMIFLFIGIVIIISRQVATSAEKAPLTGMTCLEWSNYEDNVVSNKSKMWRELGVTPQNIDINKWVFEAKAQKEMYIYGLVDAYNAVYFLDNRDRFHLIFSVNLYIEKLNLSCTTNDDNAKKKIGLVLLDINDQLKLEGGSK